MTVRAYLPTTIAVLAEQYEQGAFVVSDDVVVLDGAADDEEAEYDALMTAAAVSAALVAGAGRRVVLVAELDPSPQTRWPVPRGGRRWCAAAGSR